MDNHSTSAGHNMTTPARLLEESRIVWSRDWDALAAGWVIGVLTTLALLWKFRIVE